MEGNTDMTEETYTKDITDSQMRHRNEPEARKHELEIQKTQKYKKKTKLRTNCKNLN